MINTNINSKIDNLEKNVGMNIEQIKYLTANVNKLATEGIKVVNEESEEEVQIQLADGTTPGLSTHDFTNALKTHLESIPAGGGGTGTSSLANGANNIIGLTENNFTDAQVTKLDGLSVADRVGNIGGLTQNNFTNALKNKLNGIDNNANFKTIGDGGLTQNNFTDALKNKLDGIDTNANFKTIGDGGLTQNNFTDALKNKLNGISNNANVGITSVSQDSNPTLGGDLDVSTFDIKSSSNRDIEISPDGSGIVKIKGNTGGSGQIQLNCENNSHGVKIKGPPHSAGASYTLTLPDDDGTNGQVLKTDGSGNLSWTTQSSGGGGGGSSYITTDNEQAVSYYPLGPSGPSYSEPTESLKLEGNLRLDKNNSGTSGSLVVEDELVIKTNSTASSSSFNSLYNYSAFNHSIGPVVDTLNASNPSNQWGATNIILGDTNRITSNRTTALESSNEIQLAVADSPFSSAKSRISMTSNNDYPGTSSLFFNTNNDINVALGSYDGSDPLPADVNGVTQPFRYTLTVGGYDPNHSTPYTQQSGVANFLAGTSINIASPDVYIGSLAYGASPPGGGSQPNATNNVTISALGSIALQGSLDAQQDISIARALKLPNGGGWGTAGQVLTSAGQGTSVTWSNPQGLSAWNTSIVGFRSSTQIDMMGDTMYLGAVDGSWAQQSFGSGTNWYWSPGSGGFDQNNINSGINYTSLLQSRAQNVFITSVPTQPPSAGGTFLPENRIHLAAFSQQGNTNGRPEIILETDMGQTNVNTSNGGIGQGQTPWQGVFPKIMLCGGKWPQLHTGNPNFQQQNAGYLHMSAGNSAALLSKRIHIGKQKVYAIQPSPLGLVHDGYGPEFNPEVFGQAFQDAFDPTHGQIGTEILSLSAGNIEIVSTNPVQFHGQVSSQGQILNSDDRLKHNEEDLTNSLDVIRKLKPQKYQKTNTLKKSDFNGILEEGSYINESGFIAQDVLKIPELAYCVTGGDFTKTLKDSEGVEKEVIIEKPYSLNYNDIFTRNVSATQELDTIVTNMLTKIATLEARITELENK